MFEYGLLATSVSDRGYFIRTRAKFNELRLLQVPLAALQGLELESRRIFISPIRQTRIYAETDLSDRKISSCSVNLPKSRLVWKSGIPFPVLAF